MKRFALVTLAALAAVGCDRDPLGPKGSAPDGSGPLFSTSSSFTATDLGTLGGSWSVANAINDNGQVVGVSETTSGERHAFLWQNGTMVDLGTLGGSWSFARAINDAGQVVGESEIANGEQRAFLWTPTTPGATTGTMTDLGTLSPGAA